MKSSERRLWQVALIVSLLGFGVSLAQSQRRVQRGATRIDRLEAQVHQLVTQVSDLEKRSFKKTNNGWEFRKAGSVIQIRNGGEMIVQSRMLRLNALQRLNAFGPQVEVRGHASAVVRAGRELNIRGKKVIFNDGKRVATTVPSVPNMGVRSSVLLP